MSNDIYPQLLHELARLRSGDAEAHTRARQALDTNSDKVSALRAEAEATRDLLIECTGLLNAAVPDLRAPVDHTSQPGSIEEELAAARRSLTRAESLRQATIRAGQLPPLLPRGHHLIRNLIVYSAAMAACLLAQLILTGLAAAKIIPGTLGLWIAFIPPVIFLIAGWVATGFAGTPRIPMVDNKGNQLDFTVYKSPRLGAFLAVATIVVFFVWDLA